MNHSDLQQGTKKFAREVIRLVEEVPHHRIADVLSMIAFLIPSSEFRVSNYDIPSSTFRIPRSL